MRPAIPYCEGYATDGRTVYIDKRRLTPREERMLQVHEELFEPRNADDQDV